MLMIHGGRDGNKCGVDGRWWVGEVGRWSGSNTSRCSVGSAVGKYRIL